MKRINSIIGLAIGSRLKQQAGLSLGLKVIFTGLNFLISVVLARLLGPSEFGIFSYVLAITLLLATLAQFGLPILIVRETAQGVAKEKFGSVKGIWQWATRFSLFISLAIIVVIGILSFIWNDIFTRERMMTFVWALLFIPFFSLGNLRGASLRGLNKIVNGQIPEFIIRPGSFIILIIGAAYIGNRDLNANQAMALNVLSAAVAFGIASIMLWYYTPKSVRNAVSRFETKIWLQSSFPLLIAASMPILNHQSGILILGFFVPPSEIGIYRVAAQIAALAAFGLQTMNLVLSPRFAGLFANGEINKLQRLVTLNSRAIMGFALTVALILMLFGRQLIEIAFGPEYRDAYYPLVILLIGQIINSTVGSVVFLLSMTGYEGDTARGMAIATTSFIILSFILIPIMGINGAALATVISMIILNIVLWQKVRQRLNINSLAFYP